VPALRIEELATGLIGPVSFDIAAGECVALMGASGAGKSLLLRAIVDLDQAHRLGAPLAVVLLSDLAFDRCSVIGIERAGRAERRFEAICDITVRRRAGAPHGRRHEGYWRPGWYPPMRVVRQVVTAMPICDYN